MIFKRSFCYLLVGASGMRHQQIFNLKRAACKLLKSKILNALDLVLLFLRSKNNNKHGFPKENNQGLCPCMQGLLKSKILNALDCNPLLRRSISYHGFPFVSYAQTKGAYCYRLLLFPMKAASSLILAGF